MAGRKVQAETLLWAHLSQCAELDPDDLYAVAVEADWLVRAPAGSFQKYGTWRVRSTTGALTAFDRLAKEWEAVIEDQCNLAGLATLLNPTPTPIPTKTPPPPPTPTHVLRSTTDAIATVWAYLVKCFPTLTTADLTSTLDPPNAEYIVKDQPSTFYGVWRVSRADGTIKPDNDSARNRNQTVQSGLC